MASADLRQSVRIARELNGYLGRRGSVFADRYHLEVLSSPTQTRHALCYVLQNGRRHGEVIDARFGGMDRFSSGWWFDGWQDDSWKSGLSPPELRTVAEPQSSDVASRMETFERRSHRDRRSATGGSPGRAGVEPRVAPPSPRLLILW